MGLQFTGCRWERLAAAWFDVVSIKTECTLKALSVMFMSALILPVVVDQTAERLFEFQIVPLSKCSEVHCKLSLIRFV